MKRQAVQWAIALTVLLSCSGGWCAQLEQKTVVTLLQKGLTNAAERFLEPVTPSPQKRLLEARVLAARGELSKGCRLVNGIDPESVENKEGLLLLQLRCRVALGMPGAWRKSLALYRHNPKSPALAKAFVMAPPPPGTVQSREILRIIGKRGSTKARLLRAEALASLGKDKRALSILERIKVKGTTPKALARQVLWDKGALLCSTGRYGKAAKLFHSLAEGASTSEEGERFAAAEAVALFRQGESGRALHAVSAMLKRGNCTAALLQKGLEALAQGERWRAERLLNKALQMSLPLSAKRPLKRLLATIFEKDGRVLSAVSVLEEEQPMKPQTPPLDARKEPGAVTEGPLLLARLLNCIDLAQAARDRLREAVSSQGSARAAEMLLGVRGANGEREKTLVFLMEHGSPQVEARAFRELAGLLCHEERYQELLDLLSAYLQEHPQEFPPEMMLLAARAHLFSKDVYPARTMLQSLVDAGIEGAGELMARLLADEGDYAGALKVLQATGEWPRAPLLTAALLHRESEIKAADRALKRLGKGSCRGYLLKVLWARDEGEGRKAISLARQAEKVCKGALKEWARSMALAQEARLGKIEGAFKAIGRGGLCGTLLLPGVVDALSEAQLPVVMRGYRPLVVNDPSQWFKGEKLLLKAQKLDSGGNSEKAINTLEAALSGIEGSRFEPRIRAFLAGLLLKNLRFSEALNVLSQWPSGSDDEERELLQARVLLETGRSYRAMALLQKALYGKRRSREFRCQGMLLLGDAEEGMGRQGAASDAYYQWLKSGCPKREQASRLIHIGLVLEGANHNKGAKALFETAIGKGGNRTVVEGTFWLADLLEKMGKAGEALRGYLVVGYGLPQLFPWTITARYRAAVLLGRSPETRKDALAILYDIEKNHKGDRWGEAAEREARRIKADEGTRPAP